MKEVRRETSFFTFVYTETFQPKPRYINCRLFILETYCGYEYDVLLPIGAFNAMWYLCWLIYLRRAPGLRLSWGSQSLREAKPHWALAHALHSAWLGHVTATECPALSHSFRGVRGNPWIGVCGIQWLWLQIFVRPPVIHIVRLMVKKHQGSKSFSGDRLRLLLFFSIPGVKQSMIQHRPRNIRCRLFRHSRRRNVWGIYQGRRVQAASKDDTAPVSSLLHNIWLGRTFLHHRVGLLSMCYPASRCDN